MGNENQNRECLSCYWWEDNNFDDTGFCEEKETTTRYDSYCPQWKEKQ